VGPARIGRVRFSKSGKSVHYQGRTLRTLAGSGFKANYFDTATGEQYWISGCKKNGEDALYSTIVEIDDEVREEYWSTIRNRDDLKQVRSFKSVGKHSK